jgi:hypothetical protein
MPLAGIQKNGLDTGLRRYDGVDFHRKAGIQKKAGMPAFVGMTIWISDTYLRGPVLRFPKAQVFLDR